MALGRLDLGACEAQSDPAQRGTAIGVNTADDHDDEAEAERMEALEQELLTRYYRAQVP